MVALIQKRGQKRGAEDGPVATSLIQTRRLAQACQRCPLYRDATQAVFGEGPEDASLMLVGEQPGDREDLAGRPFVGPAGQLLRRMLDEAGIDASRCYLTNAVKHFKHEMRGKRRLHKAPNAGEVKACKWWLMEELRFVQPRLVAALGATAAAALTGKAAGILARRGKVEAQPDGLQVFITVHPSAVLRAPDEFRKDARAAFLADLRKLKRLMENA